MLRSPIRQAARCCAVGRFKASAVELVDGEPTVAFMAPEVAANQDFLYIFGRGASQVLRNSSGSNIAEYLDAHSDGA